MGLGRIDQDPRSGVLKNQHPGSVIIEGGNTPNLHRITALCFFGRETINLINSCESGKVTGRGRLVASHADKSDGPKQR
jgi:hypothetical protein